MNLYRRERILVGFIFGVLVACLGAWIRLNAHDFAAVRNAIGTVTTYPTEKVEAFSHLGLGLFLFGLAVLIISFDHWLSSDSMSADAA